MKLLRYIPICMLAVSSGISQGIIGAHKEVGVSETRVPGKAYTHQNIRNWYVATDGGVSDEDGGIEVGWPGGD